MKNNDSRLFIKSDAVYVAVVFASVVAFIALLAAQIFSGVTSTRYFIGAGLMLIAFLMNVFLGKFAYFVSFALNFVQFMIYTYEYIMMKNESAPFLLVMTVLTMVIDMLLQYYVIKIASKIQHIEDSKRDERGKAIRKELEDEMFARTSLIVNHEVMGTHQNLSEALGRNITLSIDPLTTLPGRDMITERADKLIREDIASMQGSEIPDSSCRPFTIIYLALDRFDNITRTIGHKSMDLFIQNMAHRLREAADPTDMVARIDDADFVILFKRGLSAEAEKKYADKLVKEASRAFAAGLDSMNATINYGFAHYPADSRHGGELIAKAEERMSKVSSGAQEESAAPLPGEELFKNKSRDEIVKIFERAMNDGSLHMTFQPCFTYERKLTGFEAFLRFEKNGKVIPPQVFLAAAENAGYMRRVGGFSMENSLGALSMINKIDPDLTMNINISNYQLREPDFIQSFSNIVSSTDCNVNNLILDLQEESLITSLADIRMTIEELATTGVKMALDNFGRGYSSFNAIPLLPVSILKLDGNFTSNLATDATCRILTRSAISLMHDIDITVTATGVGQEDQFEILAGSGCDRFQGLFLGSAISKDELESFINNANA